VQYYESLRAYPFILPSSGFLAKVTPSLCGKSDGTQQQQN